MQLLLQKSTCPFCFTRLSPRDIRFRCITPSCAGRTLTPCIPFFGFPRVAVCEVCKQESFKPICNHCNFELSSDIGVVDQHLVAIVGGRLTGKSHYIAALIHQLQNEVGQNFTFSLRPIGENTKKRWENDFYTPLFVRKNVLKPTLPGAIDMSVKYPLIFRLTLTSHRQKRTLNISFLDSAGEDMKSIDTLELHVKYICDADAIIFLLDPLQIPTLRQRLPHANLPSLDANANPEYIVGRMRELFESRFRDLSPTKKIKTPVAFTLSKIDALQPILARDSALIRNGEHFGHLDLDDVQSMHTEIANYLKSWISFGFCQKIEDNFAYYRYFGVSSLGGQPDANHHLAAINPIRVEDPFLWILYQLHLIKGKKGR
jgi:hypothetical protein